MGFDYENMRFTPDNHEMLPAQVIPMVFELEPGDIRYVDEDYVQLDRTARHACWIYRYAAAYSDTDVIEIGADGDVNFARIICLDEGIIVDESHTDQKTWDSVDECYSQPEPQEIDDVPQDFLPVIHRIFNQDELRLVEPVLAEQYNIVLEGTELQPLLDAIDDLEDEPDDDEEDFEEEVGSGDDDSDDDRPA